MKQLALTNFTLYDDECYLSDQAIVITNGIIETIVPLNKLDPTIKTIDCGGHLLAPGFIDIQVNGGGGAMFNSQPTLEGIDRIRQGHWSGGTTAMLPTLITDTANVMQQAVNAIAQAIESLPGILGIHLEGPHLSLPRRGVHSSEQIRPFDTATRSILDILPADNYLLTVAPETLEAGTIDELTKKGIRISAGHTSADYRQIRDALKEGLCCFTHLYNAMTPMDSREPGVVGAALEDAQSYCGIIIDGYHIHDATAKLAIAAKTRGKMLLVTDSMATVGSSQNSFELYGETIYAIDGCCAKNDGTLAGSALDMATAVRNCVNSLDISLPEALRMASLYPAEFLGIEHQYGQIKPGYRADLVLLNSELLVQKTWVLGELCFER